MNTEQENQLNNDLDKLIDTFPSSYDLTKQSTTPLFTGIGIRVDNLYKKFTERWTFPISKYQRIDVIHNKYEWKRFKINKISSDIHPWYLFTECLSGEQKQRIYNAPKEFRVKLLVKLRESLLPRESYLFRDHKDEPYYLGTVLLFDAYRETSCKYLYNCDLLVKRQAKIEKYFKYNDISDSDESDESDDSSISFETYKEIERIKSKKTLKLSKTPEVLIIYKKTKHNDSDQENKP